MSDPPVSSFVRVPCDPSSAARKPPSPQYRSIMMATNTQTRRESSNPILAVATTATNASSDGVSSDPESKYSFPLRQAIAGWRDIQSHSGQVQVTTRCSKGFLVRSADRSPMPMPKLPGKPPMTLTTTPADTHSSQPSLIATRNLRYAAGTDFFTCV